MRFLRKAEIHPRSVRLGPPDLSAESHSLAVTVRGPGGAALFHVMFNAYWEPFTFELPPLTPGIHESWRRWIDTYRGAPEDIADNFGPSVGGPYPDTPWLRHLPRLDGERRGEDRSQASDEGAAIHRLILISRLAGW